jgi:hypothetical protein
MADKSCGHCAHRGPLEHKEDIVIDRSVEDVEGFGEINWAHTLRIYRCAACDAPTIYEHFWADEFGDSFAVKCLYPTARDNSMVPARVRNRLDAAKKVRKIEPGFYAVGIRRMLETVCNVEEAQGGDLFAQLDDLAKKDRIPAMLAEIAHELRRLGNLGAHDEDVEVAPDDVPVIEDLADAILEYLYRAPAKLKAVKDGIAARKLEAKLDPTLDG